MSEALGHEDSYDPYEEIVRPLPSEYLEDVTQTYLNGHVRQYTRSEDAGAGMQRTEIDLPDGRIVKMNKNMQPVLYGAEAACWDRITVQDDEGIVGAIELSYNRATSETNRSYDVSVAGRKLAMLSRGRELDLELADYLYPREVVKEKGITNNFGAGSFGQLGDLGQVVQAMKRGFTPDMISELFDDQDALEAAETPHEIEPQADSVERTPKQSRWGGRVGSIATRFLRK